MVGRKLSTFALAGSVAIVAIAGGCRDQALTAPGTVGNASLAAGLRLQAGDGQTGGVAVALPLSLSVKVVDAGGTPVLGAQVKWSVMSGGGSVTPPTGYSNVNGLVSTTWTMGPNLGANTVRAYLVNGYNVDSVNFSATGSAGSPVIIVIDSTTLPPANSAVASALPALRYTVMDQFGHPVQGATVTFGAAFGSGSVSPVTAVSGADGSVSTTWTLGTAAGVLQSETATLPGQLPITTTVTAVPDASRKLTLISGDNQAAQVSAILAPLNVQVTDQYNNPIKEAVITFASVNGGGTMTPLTATTDAAGMASGRWQLGIQAGVQTASISTPGGTSLISATASIPFRDVFAGNYFACGITTNDRAYCWGFGENGQLGIGNTAATPTRSRAAPTWPVSASDTLAGPFPTFREISAGPTQACALTVVRTLMCWGLVWTTGSSSLTLSAAIITSIPAPPLTLGVGNSNVCLITLAGVAACAGTNEVGESGVGPPLDGSAWANISMGDRHGCAVPRFDTSVPKTLLPECWGQNDNGQLGDGTTANKAGPTRISDIGVAYDSSSIVTGRAHTCALAAPLPGAAICWGSNAMGQLGNGQAAISGSKSVVPVYVLGGLQFVRLFAGSNYTCGLTLAGQAWCWGDNSKGQFGTGGATGSNTTPVIAGGGIQFRALALGELFGCGITGSPPNPPVPPGTVGTAGTIYCWGDNEYGQVGAGFFAQNAQILGPTPVRNQ